MSTFGLDMSLNALIKRNKKLRLQNRKRKFDKTGIFNKKDKNIFLTSKNQNKDEGSKILISNLAYGVTSKDLKDLFKDIGPIKSTTINFFSNGKSKGTGQVIFIRRNDAKRAIDKYNKVELDGRPMRIEMVLGSLLLKSGSVRNRANRLRKRNEKNKKNDSMSF